MSNSSSEVRFDSKEMCSSTHIKDEDTAAEEFNTRYTEDKGLTIPGELNVSGASLLRSTCTIRSQVDGFTKRSGSRAHDVV